MDLDMPVAGEVEEKEELKNLLKWSKLSFHVMVDREIFTYLKNKKKLIKSSRFSTFKWNNTPCYS